ncbi:YceI family protein [Sphingobacterium shayense]|uniref:YceI family protein n=1 Tax=Sphingobacterium shayense TaxID=626343 RepID=UPI001552E13F|nr:YceI family protein [Sphingobacterium shayense]NQD72476.1 YceI family protein [Sphingobacterium shayense]
MKKTAWLLDEEHSTIVFRVKHMVISTVVGQFKRFEVRAISEGDDFERGSVQCTISTADVTTNDDYRDDHLKSEALLDVTKYQEIEFKSERFDRINETKFQLRGNLTIKDITQAIEIPVTYLGKNNIDGIERSAFESDFVINRDQFDLTYNTLLESGGMVIGKEININVYITLIKKQ